MSPVVVCGRPQNLARARELAVALGGEATASPWRRPFSRRPWIVAVPPTEIALAAIWRRTVIDAHTGAFGLKGDRRSARRLGLLRRCAKRADAVMVCSDVLAERVAAWGGRPLVVHEAPPLETVAPAREVHAEPRVLVPGYFSYDEPIAEALAALRLLPGVVLDFCGSIDRLPTSLVAGAPSSALFHGRLAQDAYVRAIARADIVLALTTQPESVMRVACEAVWHGRPLVVSDLPINRALFPHAVHVANNPAAIAAGVSDALVRHAELRARAPQARALQEARWNEQRAALLAVLGD
jgi:glycosyltransferase involved in cell wall biosynthesis